MAVMLVGNSWLRGRGPETKKEKFVFWVEGGVFYITHTHTHTHTRTHTHTHTHCPSWQQFLSEMKWGQCWWHWVSQRIQHNKILCVTFPSSSYLILHHCILFITAFIYWSPWNTSSLFLFMSHFAFGNPRMIRTAWQISHLFLDEEQNLLSHRGITEENRYAVALLAAAPWS